MPTLPYLHKEAFKADFEEAWKDGALYNGQTSHVGFETPFQVYEKSEAEHTRHDGDG